MEQYEKLCWYNCRVRCAFYKKDWEDCRTDEDKCCYPQLWADECLVDNCYLHEREKTEAHERLLWTYCGKGCPFHRRQFEDARKVESRYYSTLLLNICKVADCPIHRSKRPELRKRIAKMEIPHRNIHWSYCYEDRCIDYYDAKYGAGYFP